MPDLLRGVQDVFDQLDPFSLGNRIVYFCWLGLYSFTLVVVWRSRHSWVRFLCFLLNQILSVGVVISWSLTVLLAYTYWLPSAVIFVTIAGAALYLFRGKKP
jgi:hypothetical protein